MIDRALTHLAALVAIPSVPGACNAEAVAYCERVLARPGARLRRIPSPLGDADGLLASIGPEGPGGLVLSGHLDVVPVEGQDWSGDPFSLRRDGGRVLGRGTTDMKGFAACALTLRERARGPLHLALSADEETTCRSVEPLAAAVAALSPRGVIVGEPTSGMAVMRAHPGSATYALRARGRSVHAARGTEGLNAIALAGEVVRWTRRAGAAGGPRWEVTQVAGGEMVNSIPAACELTFDLRLPAGSDAMVAERALRQALGRIARAAGSDDAFDLERTAWFPPFREPRSEFSRACIAASEVPEAAPMPFGTEAGQYREAGLPTVVMGPGRLADAHLPDEGIDIAELERCLEVLSQLIEADGPAA